MDVAKVVYIYGTDLIQCCDQLPTMLNRASIVQDLINSYNLLRNEKILVVQSFDATEAELKSFHSSNYIDLVKKLNDLDKIDEYEDELNECGLDYDCPLLNKHYDFIKTVAGATLSAAKILTTKKYDIAINWFGGWHHAQRDSASGFCYVNDIVIGIQKLSKTFNKILYLDLDVHHGDGVQNAFEFSKKILTVSYHKLMPGFFPGTGNLDDTGSSKGKYYTINIPFLEGINNENYLKLFFNTFPKIMEAFLPNAIVVQCGADALCGDEIGQSNLTLKTIGECVKGVLWYKKPTLFCGGGGYNFANTARLWTYLTSVIIGEEISGDIPDDCEYFTDYGPTYELHIDPSVQKDTNNEKYINDVISTVAAYCVFIQNDLS